MKKYNLILTIFFLAFSLPANAVLIDHNTYTTDTDTSLDWLDLTATLGFSYNQINAELGQGGLFEGWSYASASQIVGLLDSAGGTGPYLSLSGNDTWSAVNNGVVVPLLDLWGYTNPLEVQSHFMYGEIWGDGGVAHGLLGDNPDLYLSQTHDVIDFDWSSSLPLDHTSQILGSALVRVSAVPLPAAVWLFSFGLTGLMAIARKRSRAK